MSFIYGIMGNSSTSAAAEAHGLDDPARCVAFDSGCTGRRGAHVSHLDVGPVGRVGAVGVRVHGGGAAAVALRLGAEAPQVVADVKQLPVDAVLHALAVQVHPEAGAGEHDGRVVLKALQEVH